jgi:ring-1,2-phenylacetyl-CoA epoxidase subunit PaaE
MDHHFYKVKIKELKPETHDSYTIVFEPHGSIPKNYLSGQFLTLKANIGGESIRRAYSLCSSPVADSYHAVTIKKIKDGKMSHWLEKELKAGQEIEVMPPIGNFVFQPHASKKRWFMLYAAGSGITPVFSMLKSILMLEPQSFVSLMFGNRTREDIIFRAELDAWQTKYPSRLKVLHTLTQPDSSWFGETGRIREQLIMATLESLKPVSPFEETQVYMCGPQEMMDMVSQVVQSQGVKKENIHRESFFSSVDEIAKQSLAESRGSEVKKVIIHLDGERHEVEVGPQTTILEAALDLDIDMPYSCQSGLCTACRGKCLNGTVHMDEREGLSDEEIREGYVLTCVGHPLSDLVEIEMG